MTPSYVARTFLTAEALAKAVRSAALIVLIITLNPALHARQAIPAPRFVVDPTWPKDMPNNWILGAVTGVFVDANDHIWVTNLPETLTEEEASEVQSRRSPRAAGQRRP